MLLKLGMHCPIMVISHSICEKCANHPGETQNLKCSTCRNRCKSYDEWNKSKSEFQHKPCQDFSQREMVFSSPNMVNNFCNWLFSSQHWNVMAIAHNARAYDAYFLYDYLLNQSITTNIIFWGSKIMYCHVGVNLNIKLLDSLNFLSMALSRLPQSFGLEELRKGYFPPFVQYRGNPEPSIFANTTPFAWHEFLWSWQHEL